MSFKIICYFDTRNIRSDLKEEIVNIVLENEGVYLQQGITQGYNISICGIKDVVEADRTKKILQKYVKDNTYSYDINQFNKEYSKYNDPNYIKALSTNKIEVKKDNLEALFENADQIDLYKNMQRDFDLLFLENYFINNNIYKLAKVVSVMMTMIDNKKSSNSHVSHFWYFFQTLNQEQKTEVYNLFKKSKNNYISNNPILEEEFIEKVRLLINKYKSIVTLLIKEKKLNFYSPSNLTELKNTREYASTLHRTTILNNDYQNEILFDNNRVTNRWVLNIIYEKFVLLKIPLIEKFFMNYLIGSQDQAIHLDESIEYNLRTGDEKIW